MPSVSFRYRAQPYSVRKKSVFAHHSIFSAGSMHTSSIHLFSEVYAQCHLKKPTKNYFFQPSHRCLYHRFFQFSNHLGSRLEYLASISIISARTGLPILPELSHVPPVHNQLSLHGSRSVSLQLYMHFRHRAQSYVVASSLAPPHHCLSHSFPLVSL